MKKALCFIFVFLILSFSTACSSNNDLQEAENIVVNYANAVINAWECGLNEDCIFEDETVEDFDSPENFNLEQLVNITGFNESMIEGVLFDSDTSLSQRTVNLYKNKFYHSKGETNVKRYNTLLNYNGIASPIERAEYVDVCTNLEMVQYLFEEIYEEKLIEKLSNISSSNDRCAKIRRLKEFTDAVVATCLDDEEFDYTFPSNFKEVSQEIQRLCGELLDISN